MDSPPRPPAYEVPSSVLSSEATEASALMIAAIPPPEYSACSCRSNCGHSCMLEYIPSCSGTSQRVIPAPLDGSGSVVSSAPQSIAIMLESFTRSTCATHPLSTCEVEPGCEPLDFRGSYVPDSPPPPYAIAMIPSLPPPEYSACSYPSSERPCLEYLSSGSGTSQRVIPDALDGRGSVVSSAHQFIAILPGSSTRPCATHPLSTCEVETGCETLDFRNFSVSNSPPRPLMITSRDVTSRPDPVVSTVPSTSCASPSNNHLLVSSIHRLIANRISQSSPRITSVEQPGRINLEDTVHGGGQRKDYIIYCSADKLCSFLVALVIFLLLVKLIIEYLKT